MEKSFNDCSIYWKWKIVICCDTISLCTVLFARYVMPSHWWQHQVPHSYTIIHAGSEWLHAVACLSRSSACSASKTCSFPIYCGSNRYGFGSWFVQKNSSSPTLTKSAMISSSNCSSTCKLMFCFVDLLTSTSMVARECALLFTFGMYLIVKLPKVSIWV